MIEFWPDCCGYKLQVEDSEAGKWIRCPYCNARIQVPQKTPDDNILADAITDLPDELATPTTGEITGPAFGKAARGLDPLRVAVTAALIVLGFLVVTVAVRQAVWFFESRKDRIAEEEELPPQEVIEPTGEAPPVENVLAELPSGETGIFVDSYPRNLRVFVHVIEGPLDKPELLAIEAMEAKGFAPLAVQLPRGNYWVFVTARLNAPELMRLPGYLDLRRKLSETGDVAAAVDYFVVDGANRLEYRESSFGIGIVLKAYQVSVEHGTWTPMTCYLIPKGAPAQLVEALPEGHRYPVEEELALLEMDYCGVPPGERRAILEMLRRGGKAVREEPENEIWRIFQITPQGVLSSAVEAVGVGQWEEPKRGR